MDEFKEYLKDHFSPVKPFRFFFSSRTC